MGILMEKDTECLKGKYGYESVTKKVNKKIRD